MSVPSPEREANSIGTVTVHVPLPLIVSGLVVGTLPLKVRLPPLTIQPPVKS